MTWAKLDLDYFRAPDFIDTELPCVPPLLNLLATLHCREYLTDGRIKKSRLGGLASWSTGGSTGGSTVGSAARDLVRSGRWLDDGDSYIILDFLKKQVSKEEVISFQRLQREKAEKSVRARFGKPTGGSADGSAVGSTESQSPRVSKSKEDFPPSAAPVKPEDNPSKPKKPRLPDPVWEDYRERYKRSTGEEPIPQKHFFIQLARIRKQLSDAQIIGRLVTYFEDPPFNLSSGARDFGRFLARIDELAPMIQSNGHVQLMPPPERV